MSVFVSVNYTNAAGSLITRPAYLIQIDFRDTALGVYTRYSTGPDVQSFLDWQDSPVFQSYDIEVVGLSFDVVANVSSTINIGIDPLNPLAITSLALDPTLGYKGRIVKIWSYDVANVVGGLLNYQDTLLLFDGFVDSFNITDKNISLNALAGGYNRSYAPRERISKANGFNWIDPIGTKIIWGTETYILE